MKIDLVIEHHHYLQGDGQANTQIVALLNQISNQGQKIMSAIDDLEIKEVALEGSVASMATLLGVIHTELVAAIAANDPTRVQAVADKLASLKTAVDTAVSANPDPTPTPTV